MTVSTGRVLVAMSGGVDSSVAAALLVEQGRDVVGVTMKTFCYSRNPGHSKTCCGLDGILDARRVANRLGIPHYVFDVEEEFTREVIDDFVGEYARGRTPNPCVRCNSTTKFSDLLRRGEQLGCESIASGHYVRVAHDADGSRLLRGRDTRKDQAYFLWGLPRSLLSRLHFPLGELTKPEVRARARELGLVTADKPESQEICFVPGGDYRELLRTRLADRHPALQPGSVVTEDGRTVGRHEGYAGYTVGQRRGLGGGSPLAVYVLEIRPETREVVVGPREALAARAVEIDDLNWLCDPPHPGVEVTVQMRHRAPGAAAIVAGDAGAGAAAGSGRRGDGADERATPPGAGGLRLELRDPQYAVTPGQSAVVFQGDRVLGGGRIRRAIRPALQEQSAPSAALG
jgi:tRNA-specific 2-thiouridylase